MHAAKLALQENLVTVAMRWRQLGLSSAWNAWLSHHHSCQTTQKQLSSAVNLLQHSLLHKAYSTWCVATQIQIERKANLNRACKNFQSVTLSRSWRTWVQVDLHPDQYHASVFKIVITTTNVMHAYACIWEQQSSRMLWKCRTYDSKEQYFCRCQKNRRMRPLNGRWQPSIALHDHSVMFFMSGQL